MEVVQNINAYRASKKAILTIGTFDGMHLGHQEIIHDLVADAKQNDATALVLTFFPHPRMVLEHPDSPKLIDTLSEKEHLLRRLGVDCLIVHPFSKAFSEQSALQFVQDVLVKKLTILKLIIGYDHRFGKNREASVEELVTFGKAYGFEVDVIPAQELNAVKVSSTKVRKAILEGDMQRAKTFLNRSYQFTGSVIQGDGIGRTLGFPTANMAIAETYKLLPVNGVYLIKSSIQNTSYFGMMNIGFRPTVEGQKQNIEVHFFDLDIDLYGQTLTVQVLDRIRDEQKFVSLEALKEQILNDQKFCLQHIKKYQE